MTSARAQHGFTLVELLVTMAIALTVFAATLNALNVFSSDQQAMTRRNAAQDQARLGIDRIVRQLRNIASPITNPKLLERAQPYDIIFQTVGTPAGSNASGAERVRYCIPPDPSPGSVGTEVMYAQVQTWTSATAPASTFSSTACPDPSPAYATSILVNNVTNRYAGSTTRPAFSFNGQSTAPPLTAIDTVGIDLFVNPTPRQPDAETELNSSAFLRNQQLVPVANFTYTALGGGSVLLNAGTSYSPSGDDLSYTWSCTGSVPCSSTGAVFTWTPGAGTYTVTLTVTDPTGLQTHTQQTVTVT